MSGLRPWLFRALLGVFIVAAVWWIFHVPYTPRRLLTAVPHNALWVGAHYDLGDRWETVVDNPLFRAALASVDPALAPPPEGKEREVWRHVLSWLCPDETVLAYVPALGSSGAEAWIMAGWLGGGSQRLRWRMGWMAPRLGLRETGRHGGRTIWRLDAATSATGAMTSFALVEGMLLGCHSSDPDAMRYLLDTIDRRRPSLSDLSETALDLKLGSDRAAPDRGWFVWDPARGWHGSYQLFSIEARRLSGALWIEGIDLPAAGESAPHDLRVPGRLLGSQAFAVAALEHAWLLYLMEAYLPNVWAGFLQEALRDQVGDTLVLALTGEEFSGSLGGFRVPTLVAAAPLNDPNSSWEGMHELLDRWNARFGWGLIPRELAGGSDWAYALEGTGAPPYAARSRDQQTALLVRQGWLLWASHAGALMKMADFADTVDAAAAPDWPLNRAVCPVNLCVRVDLRRGYPIAQMALTAYTFQHLLSSPPEAQRVRERVAAARLWLEALHPFEVLRLRMESEGQGVRLDAILGKDPDEAM